MWHMIAEEPVAFQGVIQAMLALALAFGAKLNPAEIGATLAFTAALLSFVTRKAVTPIANPTSNDGNPLVPRPIAVAVVKAG